MMRLTATLACLGALLSVASARGASWLDPWAGEPVVETFGAESVGLPFTAWAITQHPREGTIIVGGERELLSFEGAGWWVHPQGEKLRNFRSLAFDADGTRLWVGASKDLGYFERDAAGNYRFHSLHDRIPAAHLPLQEVWSCHPRSDGRVDFIATDMALRWDGQEFQVWPFRSKRRLFAIKFEGELWFHHLEDGLYRLTESGPELVVPAQDCPSVGIIHLERREGRLVALSNHGITPLAASSQPISPPEVTAFCGHRLTLVAQLNDGGLALGTLTGGLGLLSPTGELARVVGLGQGLRSSAITGLLLDRENWLWLITRNEIARMPADAAISRLPLSAATKVSVSGLAAGDRELHVATLQGIARLVPAAAPGSPPSVHWRDNLTGEFHGILRWQDAWVTTQHGSITLLDRTGPRTLLAQQARTFYGATVIDLEGPALVTHEPHLVSLLREPQPGQWEYRDFPLPHQNPTSLAADTRGRLWVGLPSAPPELYEIAGDKLQPVTPAPIAAGSPGASHVLRWRDTIWLFLRDGTWRTRAGGPPEPVPLVPPYAVTSAVVSPDESRLYVAFNRNLQLAGANVGIGVVELSADGTPLRWRDLQVPSLDALGRITALATTAGDAGGDRLWVGGSEGLLQIRPQQLPAWASPAPPRLTIHTRPDATNALPFHDHAIALSLGTADITLRPALRYQTRFGGATTWSEPSGRATFEYSNLSEGSYRFEARTVTPAGATSEPVAFTFRILPPWYRSPWAYAGYLAVLGTAAFGAVQYRLRRIRARNAELERLVEQRTADLVKANAAKDEFLASMSHEIRNPMNGVVGLSSAIDATPLNPDSRHRFDLLRHCATHLATLLEDILDFSRLQTGQIDLQEETFSPVELFEAIEALTSAESAASGLPVRTALSPQVPPQLRGDARRIRQILLNFVTNALKYAGRGKVDLTAWARSAGPGQVEVTFVVSDDGPGIPPEEQARIFAKFERGQAALRARIAGTGMGLAVCRQLAERMGGRVWLESTPGQGSSFYLALRLAIAAAPLPTVQAPAAPRNGARPRALVVDDEEYNRIAHAALLERLGFAVHTAAAGPDACRNAGAEAYDVVLLDYDLPDVHGPDLARQLREIHARHDRQPLLVAATAYTTVEKRNECLAAGMDAFLGKPLSETRLREALALNGRHARTDQPDPAVPAATHVAESPAPYAADPWDNLRTLARNNGRSTEETQRQFFRDCESELNQLHESLAHRRPTAARTAHQLSGRFGFVRAAEAAQLALDLEQAIRNCDWDEAAGLEERLAGEWAEARERLKHPRIDPAASAPA